MIYKMIIEPLALPECALLFKSQTFRNSAAFFISWSTSNFNAIEFDIGKAEINKGAANRGYDSVPLKLLADPIPKGSFFIEPVDGVHSHDSDKAAFVPDSSL